MGMIYFISFWTWRGQTLGKMVVGAKIVKRDGTNIGLGRSVLRYIGFAIYLTILGLVVENWWYLAIILIVTVCIFIGLNREKRGPHDLLAGTVVIDSRPSPLGDYEEEDYYEAEEEPSVFEAR